MDCIKKRARVYLPLRAYALDFTLRQRIDFNAMTSQGCGRNKR